MFSCILDDYNHIEEKKNYKIRQERQHEEELIDKVLNEGLKLKKKCKTLNRLLADIEAQRNLERVEFDQIILEKNNKIDYYANSSSNTEHIIQLQQFRDIKAKEIESLQYQLDKSYDENYNIKLNNQNLEKKIIHLNEKIDTITKESELLIINLKCDHEIEINLYKNQKDLNIDEIRSLLLRRAMIAEKEVERLLLNNSNNNKEDILNNNTWKKKYDELLDEKKEIYFKLQQKETEYNTIQENNLLLSKNNEKLKSLQKENEDLHEKMKTKNTEREKMNIEMKELKQTIDEFVISKETIVKQVSNILNENQKLKQQIRLQVVTDMTTSSFDSS